MDRRKLGERIQYYRTRNKLTQQQMADGVGLTREYVSKIENAAENVSLDTLVDIANRLEVSMDDLLADSLVASSSLSSSRMQDILLYCTPIEEDIIVKLAADLRKILYSLGI